MNVSDVEQLARRQWADRHQRHDYWAERYRVDGSGPARQAAAALYAHARSLNSTIFDAAHRAQDFAHHLHLCDQLDRAARAITGR